MLEKNIRVRCGGSTWAWLFGMVVLAAMSLAGCGSPDASAPIVEDPTEDEPDALVCGTFTVKTPNGPQERQEWYQIRALDNTLANYPDFASLFGADHVRDCAGARAFIKLYNEYSRSHPHFDANQPRDRTKLPRPPVVDHQFPVAVHEPDVEKLLNGVPGAIAPVVRYRNQARSDAFCTGTLIAKNFIATAAHCMWVGPDIAHPKVHKRYAYFISLAGPDGHVRDPNLYSNVLQWVDPDYKGTFIPQPDQPADEAVPHDFALLEVYDADDGFLPAGNTGDFMRISVRGFSSSGATGWGFGLPPDAENRPVLRSVAMAKYAPVSQVAGKGYLKATVPITDPTTNAPFTGGYFCGGDSGGPIVDRYSVATPGNPTLTNQPVLVATFWGGGRDSGCIDDSGDPLFWQRTDIEMDFIDDTISSAYPNFHCIPLPQSAGGPTDIAQCYGRPCKEDGECGLGSFCYRNGPVIPKCPGRCPDGTCNCLFGQCLPLTP